MNLWPAELFLFRERHLRSEAHRLIMAIGEVELRVQGHYGIDPSQEPATEDMQKFAFLELSRLYAESDEQSQTLNAAIDSLLQGRLSS